MLQTRAAIRTKTQITFFFAITILFAIGSISTVHADPSVLSTQRYRDYQVERLSDGSFRQTLGMPQYVWNGSNFVDRIISNNGTHFNVYSEMGSFSFNKSSCSITQYAKGFDPISQTAHRSDIMIDNWFWTIARKNGANPWEIIDPMMFGCSINTFQNSTGKYLEMTRTHPSTGSYLKVTLAAPNGKPIEDFNELYMNVPGWAGNKFSFVLWAKDINTNSITYRNGTTVSIPMGITTIDRSQLTVDSLNFIKNGNAFFFDWKKAQAGFKTLLINKTLSTTDIQFGFNNNATTLNLGQKIYLDPTYGYTSSGATNRVYFFDGTSGTNCQNSVSGTVTLDNTENINTRLSISGTGNGCQATIPRWDISTIPAGQIATSANLRYDVQIATNMGARTCALFEITHDPATNTATTMYYDGVNVNGTEKVYVRGDTTCRTVGNNKVISLGSNATNYITNTSISRGWFATSLIIEGVRDASGHVVETISGAGTMELEITYTPDTRPPEPITTLAETSFDTTTVDLGWTAPNIHGGTLQLYQLNYTTPCGTPLIHLPNGTTATSYVVSGLSPGVCYSFRATAVTQYGGNITGANIVNVTTLSFNPGNYTIGFFNYNVNNPVMLPIRYERIDNGTTTLVNVTFANTMSLACDLRYTYAGTNHTYHSVSSIPVSSSEDEASFRFTNSSNDITTFHCWNELGNQSANYVLTQTDFLLKQQVRDFRNGTYGTSGQLGAFDFITLVVVIISMIGLNRNTEAVGGFFAIVAVSVLAYFEIIQWYVALISALAVVILLAISSTRKT